MYELITINEKEYPIRYGMNALRIFCKDTDKTLNDLGSIGVDMTLDDSVHLIKAGLQDGHRKAGKDFSINIEDISDWLDDDMDILTKAMNIFADQYNTDPEGNAKGSKAPKGKKK